MNILFKKDTWQEIYYSLKNNKLRTFLTMIGVGWGMFLYVVLLGSAKGMENGFDKLFSGFATNSIFLWAQNTSIPYEGFPKGRAMDLKLQDVDMLQRKINEIEYISPKNSRGNFGSAGEQMSRNGKTATYSLNGDYPIGNKISEKKLIYGRYLNDADVSQNKNVAVIGEEVYKNFFDSKKNENPIGKSINVKGIFFNVIGVFRVKRGGGMDNDQTVFIPLSTFTKIYNDGDNVDVFAIVSKPNADVNDVEDKVKSELKKKNKVSPEDTNAFGSFNLGKEFKKLTGFLTGMQLLTIIVGTLTILAGVIAISNILLITVKERTKEIGIRRALGAKPSEVRNQILLESVVITLSSGLLGFIFGIFVLMIFNTLTQNQDDFPFYNPTVNYSNVFSAMTVMVVLGLIIGMIPAQRAVKIRPIEALRSE
ncbi:MULTISPECIES: ABC transporter permease [Chryseobacterium]|uniref:ABC transport system permease protein n=1 Tax=Chryseobacterium indoltheticum TaxID=254 RepID=A0A381F5K7_9FLAO|nr:MULTISPECIES: ABC transporter permease [Chryseobacterium]MDQ8144341.1 ABC transporter permease [Chryseobacterium sp. CFS15]QQQ28031.1 ABC transporter permease [Chryseobacterium indoltheticum]SIR15746.1 putative ABC transport system permease protein [Chryseobacterium indoltheticum]SUX41744.1 Macrolide export ATP-binding/permease protein MacB [Chryseobacterium indoltheticum]